MSLRFDYKSLAKDCTMTLDYQHNMLRIKYKECDVANRNAMYVHPPWQPQQSWRYQLDRVEFKIPSEHTVNGV
jgi:carbonic anhydrase